MKADRAACVMRSPAAPPTDEATCSAPPTESCAASTALAGMSLPDRESMTREP